MKKTSFYKKMRGSLQRFLRSNIEYSLHHYTEKTKEQLNEQSSKLNEQGSSINKVEEVISICSASELNWEQAIKEWNRCKTHKIKVDDYIYFNGWDIDDADMAELKNVILLRDAKIRWDRNYYIDVAFEKTGIDKEALRKKLRIVEKRGYTASDFLKKSYYYWDSKVLQELPKRTKDKFANKPQYIPEKIQEETGWSLGKYILEFSKARDICDCNEQEFCEYEIYKGDYFKFTDYGTTGLWEKMYLRWCDFRGAYRFFKDKDMFLQKFSDYIHRRWFMTRGLDFETFKSKIDGIEALMYKPLNANQGSGITKFQVKDYSARELYDEIMSLEPGLIEECIKQHPDLATLNDSSVNSIRIVTFVDNGDAKVLAAAIKTGTGEVVDNLTRGGVCAAVDIETGTVCTDAVDKKGKLHKVHPISGVPFNGFVIPHWEKLLETCKRAASVVPSMIYIGWDVSVNSDGNIAIVEGNHGADIRLMQCALGICCDKGIRAVYDKYLWFDDSEQKYYYDTVKESSMSYDEALRMFNKLAKKGISASDIYNERLFDKESLAYKKSEFNDGNIDGFYLDKDRLGSAKKQFELQKPSCYEKDVSTLKTIGSIPKPRFTLDVERGVWYNKSSKNKKREATIVFTGDNLCTTKQMRVALDNYGKYDFKESYRYVKKYFSKADCVVGNLETTLADSKAYMSEQSKTDGVTNCNAPSTFLDAIRYAGFDLMVNSNNHNCDTGVEGIFETISHLDQYKLMHTGLFTGGEERRFVILDINGINVGFMSYSTTFNGREKNLTDEGKEVLLNLYSEQRVTRDVQQAKKEGAEYIIAYIHWGIEGNHKASEDQKIKAKEMADAGVDYIIGSHPHVVQPYSVVKSADGRDVPVIYSLGNFVSAFAYNRFEHVRDSMILKICLKKDLMGRVHLVEDSYTPVYVYNKYGKGKNRYAAVPLTNKRLNEKNRSVFMEIYKRVTEIVGNDIKVEDPLDITK